MPKEKAKKTPAPPVKPAVVPPETWKDEPDDQDFPAAASYLALLVGHNQAARLARALRAEAVLARYAPKDILRASGLALLGVDNPEVARDLEKVRAGRRLSPVLLVWGEPLLVADGYHRVCASFHLDDKKLIPCRIVGRD